MTLLLVIGGCAKREERGYPNRPIKLIVPFAPGGGSDSFARVFQKALKENPDILPVSLVIQNVKGGGATIGSRRAKDSKPNGYTILLLHEAIVTAKYAGKVEYGPEAFEPIAATGKLGLVIAVADHSPYKTLQPLVDEIEKKPDTVVWACNFDTPSHFVGKMLELKTKDGRFRFANTGDGTERFAALKGGHAAVSAFSMAEYLSFRGDGLRAIAYCGPERHPGDPSVLTSHEQGYPVTSINMQFWWAPKGTPPERVAYLAEVLRKAMNTAQVKEYATVNNLEPVFATGEDMHREVQQRADAIAEVAGEVVSPLPNFPTFVILCVALLGSAVAVQAARQRASGVSEKDKGGPPEQPRVVLAVSIVALMWAYWAALTWSGLGFRIISIVFLGATCALLLHNSDRKPTTVTGVVVAVFVIGLPLLVHLILVRFFSLQLP